MLEKNSFFKMNLVDQNKLRTFMVLFAISQVVQYLFMSASQGTAIVVSKIISIPLLIMFLYFAIFIARAPDFFFRIITLPFWIVIIFDVPSVVLSIVNKQSFTFTRFLSLFKVLIAIIFIRSVMNFRRAVREAKK